MRAGRWEPQLLRAPSRSPFGHSLPHPPNPSRRSISTSPPQPHSCTWSRASLLLRRGSSLLTARDAALDTPLHLSAHVGAHKVVALLVAASSSTSPPSLCALTRATNRRGETTLQDVVRGGHEATAHALVVMDPGLPGLCGGVGESLMYMAAVTVSLSIRSILDLRLGQHHRHVLATAPQASLCSIDYSMPRPC
ncbi:hypothetical protein GUJ93_ZPchr0009g1058 [Zizania palustris]|uniref:Uncharacterized protein n=1 Tax=Zizania palustris TaxID=103762 RepID=A0A8J5V8L1_ZIZPA|nr:hypothetical protein GUJ93_ZPchr0009g1058 [Zizania palustris]